MKRTPMLIGAGAMAALAILVAGAALSAEDRYAARVPNGLALAEIRGFEGWQTINVSHGTALAVILGNPAMIAAYQAGSPANGKPFPDGAKIAKIHWVPKKAETEPGTPWVAGALHDVDVMVKDSKRFADSGGWGYGAFNYDAGSGKFVPGTLTDKPPQGNDAKCGAACHTAAKAQDYVFTQYAPR